MTIKTDRLLSRAKKLLIKGNLDEAELIYLEILQSSPNNRDAKSGILMLKNKKNQAPIARQDLQTAISLVTEGKIKKAIDIVEPLIKNYPNEAILYNIRAVCNKANQNYTGAINDFTKATSLKPDYAEAYYNLGVTLREVDDSDNAIRAYQNALNCNKNYPNAHNNLGQIFLVKGDFISAIEHLEWAVALKPEFAEAYNNLGNSYLGLNKAHEAINLFKKAEELNPNFAIAINNLGISYLRIGEVKLAKENFEKAIDLDPSYSTAHHNLSGVKTYTSNDLQISQMKSLIRKKELSQKDRIYLNFALAKANEDLGDHKEFFKFLNEGNHLRKLELGYSIEKSENHNSVIKQFFPNKNNNKKKNITYDDLTIRPIFIVGMPRSGTSLVEQIISSHHQVYGAGELRNLSNAIIPIMEEHSALKKYSLSNEEFSSIRQEYLDSLSRIDTSKKLITDKWPLNFRNIGFIVSSLPEASIVHIKRDARATCWSIYKHYFSGQGNGWAYNFDDLAKFYSLYDDLMNYWKNLYPGKIYDLSYEELTKNQEMETRKLIKYCDLNWDQNCLKFHENKRDVQTASALQVRKKIYQGSSNDWKKYQDYLKPLVKSLG
ncbi:sulfotransferase [Candidatus Thioglobus sp.]|nr:sulfotransferase [Candidatus Thioglobus sp.]